MNEDDYLPGLSDDESVSKDVRIERFATYLREKGSLELAVGIAATTAIALKLYEGELDALKRHIEPLQGIRDAVEQAFDWAETGLKTGEDSTQKLMLVLSKDIARSNRLSIAGASGGNSRKGKFAPVKEWAIAEAKKLRGSEKDIARKLALRIPADISNPSEDTERLIYDTLRANRKASK